MKRTTSTLLPAAALLALISLLGCKAQEKEITETPTPKVEGEKVTFAAGSPQVASLIVQPAEPRTHAIIHLTGRLYWNDAATVRIFTPVAGRVTAVRADLGDALEAGSPLAEIDSPDFGQALANARTAVGNLALADKANSRARELLAHGAAAQKDVETAEASYVAALAEKDRAEAVLAIYGGTDASTNSLYVLRSQLAGVLVEKNINPGQEVRADQMLANATQLCAPLYVVTDPTKLWVQLDVSELDLASLQPGQSLRIYSRAYPGKIFEGKLEHIGDSLDPTTRTVIVRGIVNNPDKLLKAEMYVTVDISSEAASAVQAGVEVPSQAVFLKGEKHYVFVQEQPEQFKRQEVAIGPEANHRVLILSGLENGQHVVTDGCILLEQLFE